MQIFATYVIYIANIQSFYYVSAEMKYAHGWITVSQESKNQRFKRLAEKRVNSAIKQLQLVGNLSSKTNYDYSEKEVEQILSALDRELKSLKTRFNEGLGQGKAAFSFRREK